MQDRHPGQWILTVNRANVAKAMKDRGIETTRDLAKHSGVSESTLYTVFATGQIRDTAVGKLTRTLHLSPHLICNWTQL